MCFSPKTAKYYIYFAKKYTLITEVHLPIEQYKVSNSFQSLLYLIKSKNKQAYGTMHL